MGTLRKRLKTFMVDHDEWSVMDHYQARFQKRERAFLVYDGLGEYRGEYPEPQARELVTLHGDWTLVEAL